MEATDSNCCSQSNDWPPSYILALLPYLWCYAAKIGNKTIQNKIKQKKWQEGKVYHKQSRNLQE